jgi:uncharacterized caspase-like protein
VDRDLSKSRAILIGNAIYRPDSGIPDLPAAAGSVAAMSELLAGDLCGWPADRIVSMVDVAAPHELARKLAGAVKGVSDVALLYYVGHGLRTPKGQLALTLGDTDSEFSLVGHTGILYESIADILRDCSAETKLVILDCCHAELGNRGNVIFQDAGDLADSYPVGGLYCIWASKAREKARTPADGELTYFTSNFIAAVKDGIPRKPEFLSIDQIFIELRNRMIRKGLPEPVESGTRGARKFPFARNLAFSFQNVAEEAGPTIPLGPRSALVIATATYQDPGLRALESSAKDAADITDVLADPDIGAFDVATLIDQSAHELRMAIEDFLSDRAADDLVLVYISCQGVTDHQGRLYFAASDTRRTRLGSTGIDARFINECLDGSRARQQIVILDCCFSGAFADPRAGTDAYFLGFHPQRSVQAAEDNAHQKFPSHGRGRIVLAGSRSFEYSFEGSASDGARSSVFTAGLVEGLRTGRADTDQDGYISVNDAYAYAYEYIRGMKVDQTPQLSSFQTEGQIWLARYPINQSANRREA